MSNASIVSHGLGMFDEALQLEQQYLNLHIRRVQHAGSDHQGLAAAMSSVGITMYNLAHFEKALQLFQEALDMRRRLHAGVDHNDLAKAQ